VSRYHIRSTASQGSSRLRRRLVAAAGVLVLGAAMLAGSAPVVSATAITPTPAGDVPSPDIDGHAGSYAWGVATMPNGSIIVGDYWNGRVLHYAQDGTSLGVLFNIAPVGGPIGPNTTPYGLAVDAAGTVYVGTYYISPKLPSVIQRWAPDGGGTYVQQTPISYGGFQYPSRVAVGNDGRVYVADMYANKIFVFNSSGAFQTSWGSQGTGNGQFNQPRGIALDQSSPQRVFVADANNKRVQVFSTSGAFLYQFGQNGTVAANKLKGNLRGIAIDHGRDAVYVVDITSNAVFRFTLDGTFVAKLGSAGGQTQTTCCSTPGGQFTNGGREVAVAGNGNVWVGDMPNHRVQVFNPAGSFLFARPDPLQLPPMGGFNAPRGVGVDANGNIIVADSYNQRIQKLGPNGGFQWTVGLRGNATGYFMNYPGSIGTFPDGSIAVADTQNNRIKRFSSTGVFEWQAGKSAAGGATGQFNNPAGVAVAEDGRVFVADTKNGRIQVLNGSTGAYITQWGASNLTTPSGIVVEPGGDVYVTDPGRKAIVRFTQSGGFVRTYTATNMRRPYGVAVDDNDRLYATDRGQHKLFAFTKAGTFLGSYGSLGGGAGQFRDPQSMAYHDGKLYISDVQNDRIAIWCVDSSCAT
jgi:sugar lactone lactonase YvrE